MYRDQIEMRAMIRLEPERARALLEEKYREGGSARQAALLLGCSVQTFLRWASSLGIEKQQLDKWRTVEKPKPAKKLRRRKDLQ